MPSQPPSSQPNTVLRLVRRDLLRRRRPAMGALVLALAAALVGSVDPWPWALPIYFIGVFAAYLVAVVILAAAMQADPLRSPEQRTQGQELSAAGVFTGKAVLAGLLFIPLAIIGELPWLVGFGIPMTEAFLALAAAAVAAWMWALVFVGTAAYSTPSLKVFAPAFLVLLVLGSTSLSLVSEGTRGGSEPLSMTYGMPPAPSEPAADERRPSPSGPAIPRISGARVHGSVGNADPRSLWVSLDVAPRPSALPGLLEDVEVTVSPGRDGPEGSGSHRGQALLTQIDSSGSPPLLPSQWISDAPIRWLSVDSTVDESEPWVATGFSVAIPRPTARAFRDSGGRVTMTSRLVALEPLLLARLTPRNPQLTDHRIRWRIDGWDVDADGPRLGVRYRSSRLEAGTPRLTFMGHHGFPNHPTAGFHYILHHRERGEGLILESGDSQRLNRRSPSLLDRGGGGESARLTLVPVGSRFVDRAVTGGRAPAQERTGPSSPTEWAAWLEGAELLILAWEAGESSPIELEWEDDGSGIHIGYSGEAPQRP